ncbi:MAG: DUF6973 domain-containing protein [Verrucomicrobiales bacterium]
MKESVESAASSGSKESHGGSRGGRWRRGLARVSLAAAVTLLLGVAVLWLLRHAIANAFVDEALGAIAGKAEGVGIHLVDLQSEPVEIPTPFEVRMPEVRSEFDLGPSNRNQLRSDFSAGLIRGTVAGVFPPKARLHVEDFSLKFHEEDLPEDFPFDSFHDGEFHSSPLPVSDPNQAVDHMLAKLKELFRKNEVEGDFDFSGDVSIHLGPVGSVDARLFTEDASDGFRRLRFDRDDLVSIAKQAGVVLADEELDLLSKYPLRAPLLVLIANHAKQLSKQEAEADPSFPEDAYRHVLWSYQLTKAFGPAFAQKVTDAHETLPNNTEDERAMDYHNNATARQFALDGVPAAELRQKVLQDPQVIRDPAELSSTEPLRR